MKRREPLVLAAALLAVALFLTLQVSPLVNRVTEDESTVVYDAQRLVGGEVPYRDFFYPIPPGAWFMISGGPWGWWGRPETGARYVQLLLLLGATLFLSRSLKSWKSWAIPLAALLPVAWFPQAPFVSHHWFAQAAYLGAIVVAFKIWLGEGRGLLWIVLGGLVGATLSVLQMEGLQAAVLAFFTLLLAGGPWSKLASRAGRLLAGAGAVIAAWAVPLAALGAGPDMVRDVLWWPVANYRKPGNIADLPLLVDLPERLRGLWTGPGGVNLPVALSGTVLTMAALLLFSGLLAASLVHLARVVFKRTKPSPLVTCVSVLTVAAFGAFSRVNPTWVHWIYGLVPVSFLWLLLAGEKAGPVLRRAVCAGCAVVLVTAAVYHSRALWTERHALWEFVDVDRVDREGALNRALRALPLLKPGDRIVVIPSGGNIYLYSYPAAIGYTYLFTLDFGHFDWEDHRRAAEQIAANRPKLVLIHKISEAGFVGNENPVAWVLRKSYVRRAETPAVVFYLRRDLLPAVPAPDGVGAAIFEDAW